MRYKRQAEGYVWCDVHGEIHERNRNPYRCEGDECDRDNGKDYWRRVYVETDDRDERF